MRRVRSFWLAWIVTCGIICPAQVHTQWGWGYPARGTLVPATPLPATDHERLPPPARVSVLGEAEQTIVAELDQPHDWDLPAMTLSQLAAMLRERVPCQVDTSALSDVGLTPDVMLEPLQGRSLTTRTALTELLGAADLEWTIADGCLLLTTPEAAESKLRLFVLPVADLVEVPGFGDGPQDYDYDTLIELIVSVVRPDTWEEGNARGIEAFSGALVMRQTWDTCDQIGRLCNALRRISQTETDRTHVMKSWYGLYHDADQPLDYERHVTFDGDDMPLTELVARLWAQENLRIRLDRRSFEDENIDTSRKVHVSAHDEPLHRALRRALEPHDLMLASTEASLVITTADAAQYLPTIRVYPIQDLVDADLPQDLPWAGFAPADGHAVSGGDADCLVEILTCIVDPSSWEGVGGAGGCHVAYHPSALVVVQTMENHERVADLLQRLRKVRDIHKAQLEQRGQTPDRLYVAVYELAQDVPVSKTIALLRQLIPALREEDREGQELKYVEAFGRAILVCHVRAVHQRIAALLPTLGVTPRMDPTGITVPQTDASTHPR